MRGPRRLALALALALLAPGCALLDRGGGGGGGVGRGEVGIASWYDPGRRTVRGVRYDGGDLTAAHRTLPFGTLLRVTSLADPRRSAVVVVNDRGPFVRGRVVDVSVPAARRLGIVRSGLARVRLDVVRPARAAQAAPSRRRKVATR